MRKAALVAALTAVTLTLCAQSAFTEPADELKALKKDIEELKGRQTANRKQVQEIKTLLGLNPKAEEARPPLAETRRSATVGGLDDRQRAAVVRALAAQPAGTPVWFAVYEQDPAARELGRALQAVFGEARWVVRGMREVLFAIKPGVFLFAADEEPPAYVKTAQEALGLAGIRPTVGTGYRSYYDQMRTKPGWRGFEMVPDQTYLIVIGPIGERAAGPLPRSDAAPTGGNSKLLVVGLVGAALLAAGGGAWYFFMRPRPAADAEPVPEEAPPP